MKRKLFKHCGQNLLNFSRRESSRTGVTYFLKRNLCSTINTTEYYNDDSSTLRTC